MREGVHRERRGEPGALGQREAADLAGDDPRDHRIAGPDRALDLNGGGTAQIVSSPSTKMAPSFPMRYDDARDVISLDQGAPFPKDSRRCIQLLPGELLQLVHIRLDEPRPGGDCLAKPFPARIEHDFLPASVVTISR